MPTTSSPHRHFSRRRTSSLIRASAVPRSACPERIAGFTLIELIIVIVIMGILAAVAAPRFFDQAAFDERGFYDDTLSALRYAQKLAVATGCGIRVTITASGYELKAPDGYCSSNYTQDVRNPGSGATQYTNTAPAGLTLSPATVTFNAQGQASSDTTITLSGTSETRNITIVAETGFVY